MDRSIEPVRCSRCKLLWKRRWRVCCCWSEGEGNVRQPFYVDGNNNKRSSAPSSVVSSKLRMSYKQGCRGPRLFPSLPLRRFCFRIVTSKKIPVIPALILRHRIKPIQRDEFSLILLHVTMFQVSLEVVVRGIAGLLGRSAPHHSSMQGEAVAHDRCLGVRPRCR